MIIRERFTVERTEPFVVFLIGARINHWWAVSKWGWAAMQMGKMIGELQRYGEQKGFLGQESFSRFFPVATLMVSYWRSFEDLERFARSKDDPHLKAWQEFYRIVGLDGSVGIWHETYTIQPGSYEAIYANMPLFGLAKATGQTIPVKDFRAKARGRMTGQAAQLAPELEVEEHYQP